jgi:hypothetical protein
VRQIACTLPVSESNNPKGRGAAKCAIRACRRQKVPLGPRNGIESTADDRSTWPTAGLRGAKYRQGVLALPFLPVVRDHQSV